MLHPADKAFYKHTEGSNRTYPLIPSSARGNMQSVYLVLLKGEVTLVSGTINHLMGVSFFFLKQSAINILHAPSNRRSI